MQFSNSGDQEADTTGRLKHFPRWYGEVSLQKKDIVMNIGHFQRKSRGKWVEGQIYYELQAHFYGASSSKLRDEKPIAAERVATPVCSESQPNHVVVILSPIVQHELLSLNSDGFPITAFGNDDLSGLLS